MSARAEDPRTTEGYSLPLSLHKRIREESSRLDMNRSDLVRKAVRMYLDYLDAQKIANRHTA